MTDLMEEVMGCLPPLPENTVDDVPVEWLDQLKAIFLHVKKGRLAELNGGRPREWGGDGLHQLSYMWGQLDKMTPDWLIDALANAASLEGPHFTPKAVKDRALVAATDEYTDRLLRAREDAHPSARTREP